MLTNRSRLVIAVEGTPIVVRFVPHRTDATKIMLKSEHPEGAAGLLLLGGLTPGETIQGSSFFLTEVDRAEFLAALPKLVATILEHNIPTPERVPVPAIADSSDAEDVEPYSGHGDF